MKGQSCADVWVYEGPEMGYGACVPLQIFTFITDKDVFGELYRQQLSKRLLNQVRESSRG